MNHRFKNGCCCCRYMHCLEAENATLVVGTSATITMAPDNYINKDIYQYRYCVDFIGATGTELLQISNGTTTYPVWDRNGEPLKIGRLRRCEVLELRFCSSSPAHFTLLNCPHRLCIRTEISSGEGSNNA